MPHDDWRGLFYEAAISSFRRADKLHNTFYAKGIQFSLHGLSTAIKFGCNGWCPELFALTQFSENTLPTARIGIVRWRATGTWEVLRF